MAIYCQNNKEQKRKAQAPAGNVFLELLTIIFITFYNKRIPQGAQKW